jgi:RNA exonuclease 1
MLEVLPRTNFHHRTDPGVYKLPLVNSKSATYDIKRKYTETFNLAAQEFVPAKGQAAISSAGPTPTPDLAVHPSINANVRRAPLDMIYKVYKELYASLPDPTLVSRDAALEELNIAKTSPNVQAYQVAWRQQYSRLKKRLSVTSPDEACTLYDLERRKLEFERITRWKARLTWSELSPLVPSKEELTRWGYTTNYPPLRPFKPDEMTACHRCTTMFTPQTRTQYPCISHWGKLLGLSIIDTRPNPSDGKIWTCCQKSIGSRGCTTNPCHVRKVSNAGELASLRPFIELDQFIEGQHLSVVSLDCEMAYTLNGMELVRMTVLDENDRLLIDTLVLPETEITDFNTRFSGITKEMFEVERTVSFDEAIEMLKYYVSRTTIIIGHGLENDLLALRLVHYAVIDTALLYPHPRGRPYRLGLKDLMRREIGLDIQTAGENGHSSLEDAGAASILVRKRARKEFFPGIGKVKLGDDPGETL